MAVDDVKLRNNKTLWRRYTINDSTWRQSSLITEILVYVLDDIKLQMSRTLRWQCRTYKKTTMDTFHTSQQDSLRAVRDDDKLKHVISSKETLGRNRL